VLWLNKLRSPISPLIGQRIAALALMKWSIFGAPAD